MKRIVLFSNIDTHCSNMKEMIKEYSTINYYGFPKIHKIVVISKFPRIKV